MLAHRSSGPPPGQMPPRRQPPSICPHRISHTPVRDTLWAGHHDEPQRATYSAQEEDTFYRSRLGRISAWACPQIDQIKPGHRPSISKIPTTPARRADGAYDASLNPIACTFRVALSANSNLLGLAWARSTCARHSQLEGSPPGDSLH